MTDRFRIIHVTTFARSGGGMQGMVRRHRRRDAALGFTPAVAAIFEPALPGVNDAGLAAAWWWTPARLRRRFIAEIHPGSRGSLAVYHNGWGLPLFAPGDGAFRRLAFLHTDWPGLAAALPAMAPWCDAFICVSPQLVAMVRRHVPQYPVERVHFVPYPVEPPPGFRAPARVPDNPRRPLVIGYAGRLEKKQKRLERLPRLMRQLHARLGNFSWHIIGDGPLRRRLEQQTRDLGPVKFHGWLTGEAYWRTLAALDVSVMTSDFEGSPIALLEAMSLGVVPFYPAIGDWGEEVARSISPLCAYPAGDMAAAADALLALAREDFSTLRARAVAAVAPHTPAAYEEAYASALHATIARPGYAVQKPLRQACWSDWLPLAVIGRVYENALWR